VWDPIRTPRDLKIMRALAFTAAALLFALTLTFLQYGAVAAGFFLAALFALLAGFGQTAILRSLDEHPGHEGTS
jgi:hypothetical protein